MDLIADWIGQLKRKAESTRTAYRSALSMVLRDLGMTVEEFVIFARDKIKFHKRIRQYFENLPLAPLTINLRIASVHSFLSYMGIEFDSSVIDVDRSSTKQGIFDVEIPSQQKLAEITEKADVKEKAAIALLGFCGLRPLLASNICVKDIEDCEISDGHITFTKYPVRINVQRDYPGNKANVEFFVFLIEEGAGYIKALLDERKYIGQSIKLLGAQKRMIQYWIANAFHRCNFRQKTYVLRSYYDNALGQLDSYKRSFYMGHTGDLSTRYIMRKKLSPERIDELRTEFKTLVKPRLIGDKK